MEGVSNGLQLKELPASNNADSVLLFCIHNLQSSTKFQFCPLKGKCLSPLS